MIVPLIALVSAGWDEVDMVYSARFYSQGTKPSYHQVFVLRHDGKFRQQISDPKHDCYGAVWVDPQDVAYVEGEEKETRVLLYNIESKKTKVLAPKGKFTAYVTKSTDDETGYARAIELSSSGEQGTSFYRPTLSGMEKLPALPDVVTYLEKPTPSELEAMTRTSSWKVNWVAQPGDLDEDQIAESTFIATVSFGSVSKEVKLHGQTVVKIKACENGDLLVTTGLNWNKFRLDEWLYRVSASNLIVTPLVSGLGGINVRSDDPIWFANQVQGKDFLVSLKNGKSVYANYLYSGNWKTGKRWTLADGLVWVSSAHRRPKS